MTIDTTRIKPRFGVRYRHARSAAPGFAFFVSMTDAIEFQQMIAEAEDIRFEVVDLSTGDVIE